MAELRRFDPDETIVMHGTARGADEIAGTVARSLGFTIEEYPASWTQFGRRAGIIRNLQMLDEKPDYVLAFWDGQSKGTAHCIEAARRRNIPVIFGGVWKP
jgi:hypothetical protein